MLIEENFAGRVDKSIIKCMFYKQYGRMLETVMRKYSMEQFGPWNDIYTEKPAAKVLQLKELDKDVIAKRKKLASKVLKNSPPKHEVQMLQPFVSTKYLLGASNVVQS